jgi:poly-gamma-glutamate synthesis protein (capsule biosynthesis protein)
MADERITLMALGDIWLARLVAYEINRNGPRHPFARIASYLRPADIVFGNLESPISTRGSPEKNKDVVDRAAPGSLEGLVHAGIGVVSLANNHIMDYGPQALQDTLQLLDDRGIGHLGAGMTRDEADRPLVLAKGGITISFHAYLCWGEAARRPIGPKGWNRARVAEELRLARRQADLVIAALHGGSVFQDHPTLRMIKQAHWAANHGADVVIGHHPHVIQGIERYKGSLIAYSLGNFLFDNYQHELADERTRQGLILELDIRKTGSPCYEYRPIPVRITDQLQVEVIPEGEDREAILRRLDRLSSAEALSEQRGFSAVDEAEMVGKIKTLLMRKPAEIVAYFIRNFFRLTFRYLPALFRLGWRRTRAALKGRRGETE